MQVDAGQLLNIFTMSEIQLIKDSIGKIKNCNNQEHHTTNHDLIAYTGGFEKKDLIYKFIEKIVLSKMEKHLGRKLNLGAGMLLDAKIPWTIHTDYVKNDQHPDLAILIPLNTAPLQTNTIIFNEICLDNFENYRKNNTKPEVNATHLHDTLMSHETVENLEYVSVLKICPWLPGSMVYWDRRLLHSSDDFSSNSVKEKQALVLFTNFDQALVVD